MKKFQRLMKSRSQDVERDLSFTISIYLFEIKYKGENNFFRLIKPI